MYPRSAWLHKPDRHPGKLEVIEFGEEKEFNGEVLPYLAAMGEKYSAQGNIIMEEYQKKKRQKE